MKTACRRSILKNYTGGIEATYLTPIYAALIVNVGAFAPRRRIFLLTAACAAAFAFIVLGEGAGIISPPRVNHQFNPALSIRVAYL